MALQDELKNGLQKLDVGAIMNAPSRHDERGGA